MRTPSLLLSCAALIFAGCPSDPSSSDAGSDTDAPRPDAQATDAPLTDAPLLATDAPTGSDGGMACEPTPGPAMGDAYCDGFELSLFTFDDAAPEVRLRGRLNPDGATAGTCAVVDTVEVQEGGVTVATLTGNAALTTESERAILASGPVFPALSTRCAGDERRFSGFGFIVHGRVDGGSFTARCADAEGGSRWPPAVRVTCHHNVSDVPYANAMVSVRPGFSSTTLSVQAPHAPGAALLTVAPTVHVIPGFGSFGAPPPMVAPFDATGWMTSVSEGSGTGPTTYLSLFASEALFPIEICPAPSTGIPGPGDPLPPVFLARVTGTGERGAYSTEAYVNICFTSSGP
jgi:hypothetical protein